MAKTESQKRATDKYDKNTYKHYKLRLNIKYDQELIEKLESVPVKNAYFKKLILEDIRKDNEDEKL